MAIKNNTNPADQAFEMSRQGSAQMTNENPPQQMITEEDVSDLKYVDVSGRPYCVFKRLLDILLSAVGILVLLVPMLLVALAVYIDDRGPVIFTQYRVGLNGKRFRLYKFRTMKMSTPQYTSTMDLHDPQQYITRMGRIMRKTSLDEIPQLLNVLKGDMSLIGPRPLISEEYEIHAMRSRFGVYSTRPGVTGLAQINGRDTVSPSEKVHWDVKYLENFGLMMDLRILFNTLPKMFGGDGIAEGYDDPAWKQKPNQDD